MTTRRAVGAVLVCGCALALGSCDSGMSPSDIDVDGSWTGTWRFVTAGVTVTDTVTARLTQDGSNASGTWMSESGPSGDLTFTVGASISGTLTITQTTLIGQTCSATTNLSGSAASGTIEFTTTEITPGGICQWAASNQFSFRR
ncbi:MAG TPA: hypothetical protein VES67_03510 [Vicinamibacterales bacterium]|nr:hypothetical protein [Vicinamibacterales bacterium]